MIVLSDLQLSKEELINVRHIGRMMKSEIVVVIACPDCSMPMVISQEPLKTAHADPMCDSYKTEFADNAKTQQLFMVDKHGMKEIKQDRN